MKTIEKKIVKMMFFCQSILIIIQFLLSSSLSFFFQVNYVMIVIIIVSLLPKVDRDYYRNFRFGKLMILIFVSTWNTWNQSSKQMMMMMMKPIIDWFWKRIMNFVNFPEYQPNMIVFLSLYPVPLLLSINQSINIQSFACKHTYPHLKLIYNDEIACQ